MFASLLLGIAGVAAAGAAHAEPASAGGAGTRLVGWDTYRRLDRLPYLSADSQTLQLSSFDRSGGDFDISTGNRNGTGGCLTSGVPAVSSPKIVVRGRLIRSGSPAMAETSAQLERCVSSSMVRR
ncbi:hypothetical protein I552_6606 [Mycobacterium xenopi 3993]|nr:hypothetical protein I552_6606 [Mycobacterium xenopi 3993]